MVIKQEELLRNPGYKCYYVVKRVEPVMDEKLQEGAIWAERVYKNAKVPGEVFVDDETWHTDWQLVPKDEEHLHHVENLVEHGHPTTVNVLPRWMDVPPLMSVFLQRHGYVRDSKRIRMHYDLDKLNKPHIVHRVAEEDEQCESTINRPIKSLLWDKFKQQDKR